MDKETAISIIDNCSGFTDDTSSVGEAWEYIQDYIKNLEAKVENQEREIQKVTTRLALVEKVCRLLNPAYLTMCTRREGVQERRRKMKETNKEFINNVENTNYDDIENTAEYLLWEALDRLEETDRLLELAEKVIEEMKVVMKSSDSTPLFILNKRKIVLDKTLAKFEKEK